MFAAACCCFIAWTPSGLIAELPGLPGAAIGLLQFKESSHSSPRAFLQLELSNFDICQLVTTQSSVASSLPITVAITGFPLYLAMNAEASE